MELDPKILEEFQKLGLVADTLKASFKAGTNASKSATLEALNEIKAQKELIKTLKEFGYKTDDAAIAMAKKIKAEEKSAAEEEKRIVREKEIDELRKAAVKKAVEDLKSFAVTSVQASQSIYNSNEAYTAVIPTLNLMGTALKASLQAIAGLASGIPFIGGVSEGASKLVGAAVDISVAVASAQLQNAQKYINTYTALSKVGVTFGGAIEKMRQSAADGGMALDDYQKFITSNIQNLSILGGSTEDGAARVSKFGKTIADSNPKLLAMYGSFDALQGATSDYMAIQARYGIDISKNDKDLTAGAKEYLFNMKELSALTGKNADELKKAEEERAKSAAYDLALSRMGREEGQNTRNAIEFAQKNFGDVAAKYAQEFIATNGNVTSEAALQFKAMYPEISKTVDMTLGATKQGTEAFNKQSAEIIQARIEMNRKEVEAREGLFKLQAGGVQGPMLEMANNVGAAFLKNINASSGMIKTIDQMIADRNKGPSSATVSYADTIKGLRDFKMGMDAITEKNLPQTGKLVTSLLEIQEKIDDVFGKRLISATNLVIRGLIRLGNALPGGNEPAGPVAGNIPQGNDRQSVARRNAILNANPEDKQSPAVKRAYAAESAKRQTDDVSKFNAKIKQGPNGALKEGKTYDSKIADILNSYVNEKFPISQITGLNDAYHSETDSKHALGRAVDFTLAAKPTREEGQQIVAQLKDLGFTFVQDEYNNNSNRKTGDHIHAQLKAGGITNGTSIAGEAGPEAVVPLPDGRTIPVKMDTGELVDAIRELIAIAKDQRDNSEKLLWTQSS